jgi:hypothetical protein
MVIRLSIAGKDDPMRDLPTAVSRTQQARRASFVGCEAMSELIECNYCTWQYLKSKGYRLATEDDLVRLKLTSAKARKLVFVVTPGGKEVCCFRELPDHCCC